MTLYFEADANRRVLFCDKADDGPGTSEIRIRIAGVEPHVAASAVANIMPLLQDADGRFRDEGYTVDGVTIAIDAGVDAAVSRDMLQRALECHQVISAGQWDLERNRHMRVV